MIVATKIYRNGAPWLLLTGAVIAVAAVPAGSASELAPVALGLAAACAASAWIATRDERARPIRLAQAFALASLLVLPPLSALLVALAGLAASRGTGVAGPWRHGAPAAASVSVALAASALGLRYLAPPAPPGSAAALAILALAFGVVQAVSIGLARLLDSRSAGPGEPKGLAAIRRPAAETSSVLLAWILAALLSWGAGFLAVGLALAVVLGQVAAAAIASASKDLRATSGALAERLSELATLHAIGREMLSSLDPVRIFGVVERECRKILAADDLAIALVDPDTAQLATVHRWTRAGDGEAPTPSAADGLTTWVALEKRGVRIDDLHDPESVPPIRREGLSPQIRSALAVPLVVEERVTGVLTVRSAGPGAYDDHHLSLLTTIAQQVAVAIENARRYEMATVDSLTRLFRRDYFDRRLEDEHNRSRRYGGTFALLMLDLDDFKQINDRFGHLAGDRFLRAFGATVRARLRAADLACRYGGDEFCLLLPETDLDGARAIAERLRQAVARLVVEVEGGRLRTTVSIGVAVFPDHDIGDLRGLLLRADQALYQAKREGRDRVVPFAA